MKLYKVLTSVPVLFLSLISLYGCGIYTRNVQKPDKDVCTISFGYWDIDNMQNAAVSDSITQSLEEKFEFHASAQSFNWSTYKQQYQILAATGDLPDVFTTVMLSSNDADDTALFNQMVENNAIRPLPDDLSDYPNLERLISKYDHLRHTDGHFYAIPHPQFTENILSSSDAALLVRRDWMDALGIADPQNIEDFIDMVSAFASQDPDGNGIDDTVGYNVNTLAALGKWVMLGIAPECNVYSWIQTSDQIYCPAWMTEDFRNVVKVYRTLYDTGGLDPDFYAKNPSAVVDDFVSGRLGALEYKSSAPALVELKDLWDSKNELPFSECVDVLPIFPAPDGIRYSNSSNTFWSETYISASVTEEKMEIILRLLDYLLSDEGMALYNQGIEGTDYTVSEDGTPVSLITETDSSHIMALMKKYPSVKLWSNIANRGWDASYFEDTTMTRFLYGKDCIKLVKKSLDYCRNHTVQVQRPYAFLTFPKETSSYGSSAFQAFIQCIIGEDDPLTMWDNSLNNLCNQGLESYVERQNQLYLNAKSYVNPM